MFKGILEANADPSQPFPSVWSSLPNILLDTLRLAAIGAGVGLAVSIALGYLLRWGRRGGWLQHCLVAVAWQDGLAAATSLPVSCFGCHIVLGRVRALQLKGLGPLLPRAAKAGSLAALPAIQVAALVRRAAGGGERGGPGLLLPGLLRGKQPGRGEAQQAAACGRQQGSQL